MSNKYIISLFVLLLFSLSAPAQQVPSATPASGFLHADTLRAVQRLFQKRRAGGWVWTTVGALFTGRIVGSVIGGSADVGSLFTSLPVLGGVPAGIGIGKLTRFGQSHEEQIITAYNNRTALPAYVRRRLKPKYFKV